MNYIVFDLEWNQSPGGKARENPRIPFEIIEIGAVKLDSKLKEIGKFSEVVRPLVYHKLHFRMKQVVPLDEEELENARTFSRVARDFLSWCAEGGEYTFVTWGNLDVYELQRNMDYYHIDNPFPKPLYYIDLQKMYSIKYDNGKSRIALDEAVDEMKLEHDMPFHRAYDDAYYTARVMKEMDYKSVKQYISVDYYRLPSSPEEEIFLEFPEYSKYVSREFKDKAEAMSDKTVRMMTCYKCNLPVWKKIRWYSTGTNLYLNLVRCPRHGLVKGKIRLKPTPGGGIYVVKTIKKADEEDAEHIRDKRAQIQEKRRRMRSRKKQ